MIPITHTLLITTILFIKIGKKDWVAALLYISLKKLNYTVLDNLSTCNNIIESLFIEIVIPGNKIIIVGVIYRPPSSNAHEFLLYLSETLQNASFNNKDCFVIGDFNIDLLKHLHSNVSQEFLETILSASFLPLISKPTRVANTSATLIDNFFFNITPHFDSYIILSDISDHYPIMTHCTVSKPFNNNGLYPSRRKITVENLARLGANLENTDWYSVYSENEINCSFEMFSSILNNQLDTNMPKQKVKHGYKKTPKLPWISKSILRSIKSEE